MVLGVLGARAVPVRRRRTNRHGQPRHDERHRHAEFQERREGAAEADDGEREWECGDWDDESYDGFTCKWIYYWKSTKNDSG